MNARYLTSASSFIGSYGPDYRTGILSEHLDPFTRAGGVVRQAASGSGRAWAVVDGVAYAVVCSELIPGRDCDGYPVVLRCGAPATEWGCCEVHAAQVHEWTAQTAAEEAAWELSFEMDASY